MREDTAKAMVSSSFFQGVIKEKVEEKKAFSFLKDGVFINKQKKMGIWKLYLDICCDSSSPALIFVLFRLCRLH